MLFQEMYEMQSRLEQEQKQRSSLTEEVDGLSWKVQELADLQEVLHQVRTQLFQAWPCLTFFLLDSLIL